MLSLLLLLLLLPLLLVLLSLLRLIVFLVLLDRNSRLLMLAAVDFKVENYVVWWRKASFGEKQQTTNKNLFDRLLELSKSFDVILFE